MMNRTAALAVIPFVLAACGPAEEPAEPEAVSQETPAAMEELKEALELDGAKLYTACQGCHTLREGEPHTVGPNLFGMMGQPAATRPGYDYSEAMKNTGITWNAGMLRGFIIATERMVPGSWMAYYNINTADEMTVLIDYIVQETGNKKGSE